MSGEKNSKTNPLTYVWEFIKLQLAGNVLFLGTLIGFFVGESLLNAPVLPSLIIASILAHSAFFLLNRNWVFASGDEASNKQTISRFILFMGLNFILNILMIEIFANTLRHAPDAPTTGALYGAWSYITDWLTPMTGSLTDNWQYYVAQVLTGLVFSVWSFIGLRFWVFASPHSYAEASRQQALIVQTKRKQHTER